MQIENTLNICKMDDRLICCAMTQLYLIILNKEDNVNSKIRIILGRHQSWQFRAKWITCSDHSIQPCMLNSYWISTFVLYDQNCRGILSGWIFHFFISSTHDHNCAKRSKLLIKLSVLLVKRDISSAAFFRVVYSQVSISHKENMKCLHCSVDDRGCSFW